MPSYYADVCDFMDQAGQDVRVELAIPSNAVKWLRHRLHAEEMGELQDAIEDDDLIEIADGIADVIVVVAGTAAAYGIDLDAVWAEVHASNMRKLIGGPVLREDGKLLKPEGWEPPNIARVLGHRLA